MTKYYAGLIGLFILDRLTKIYFETIDKNAGIAFSLSLPDFILYFLLTIVFLLVIFFWIKNIKSQNILKWPWGLVVIGAFSNILDRLKYGGVIDFINLPYFAIFNLSDVFICFGVLWILCYNYFIKKYKKYTNEKTSKI